MATTEKSITVDGTFKIKIGDTEISLTREEADRLYGELFKALGKQPVYWPYPITTPTFPTVNDLLNYYKVGWYTISQSHPNN